MRLPAAPWQAPRWPCRGHGAFGRKFHSGCPLLPWPSLPGLEDQNPTAAAAWGSLMLGLEVGTGGRNPVGVGAGAGGGKVTLIWKAGMENFQTAPDARTHNRLFQSFTLLKEPGSLFS